MTADIHDAFAALRFDWAQQPRDVWRRSSMNVDGLHGRAKRLIEAGISDAIDAEDTSPIGVIVRGRRGSGKTHLMGWVRERIQAESGYFFLVGPLSGTNIWKAIASAFRRDLAQPMDERGTPQLEVFLRALATKVDAEPVVDGLVGNRDLHVDDLETLVLGLRKQNRVLASETQDTLRALALYNSPHRSQEELGKGYLLSEPELTAGERAAWGIREPERSAMDIVSDITRLMALTGPIVVAFDQVDSLEANLSVTDDDEALSIPTPQRDAALAQIGDGLLLLRDISARTLTVLSCLPHTWERIVANSLAAVDDRFRPPVEIHRIGDAALAATIVERRFERPLSRVGFERPYPTWPVRAEAFETFAQFTPRRMLQRIYEHVNACVETGALAEIADVAVDGSLTTVGLDEEMEKTGGQPDLESKLLELDSQFASLRSAADVSAATDSDSEGWAVPPLLEAGLTAWIQEQGIYSTQYTLAPEPGPRADLHARISRSLNDETGAELSWSFRAIASTVPQTALWRLRGACDEAGIKAGDRSTRLIIWRTPDWNSSPKTTAAVVALTAAGGQRIPVADDDLRTFAALRSLFETSPLYLQEWIISRRPASKTMILAAVLGPQDDMPAEADNNPKKSPRGSAAAKPTARTDHGANTRGTDFSIGRDADGNAVRISLSSLRRHTVIYAGSGSGKTVLIRRLVEECALRGVSSIILDINNDLARLGEAWPELPDHWDSTDSDLARDYLANTDVVIWTPRRNAGRPLAFQPLPNFASVVGDEDELDSAIDAAVATLASRISMGAANRARVNEAVLREALRYHARKGANGDLQPFLDLLSDLPSDVTDLDPQGRIALSLAQALRAAVVNDPMFGGRGEPMDPGVLLTPTPGKTSRVSVISLTGLTSDDQKQGFVNQLQMGLFSWIKKNPADPAQGRTLGGLLVMDEAQNYAPSRGKTICTASTLALVAQARKYGLGLIFATQHPRGLDNYVPGNAATQFFGLLKAPAQIATAQELARGRGGDASDIGRLAIGDFYLSSDDVAFRRLRAPMCLSHHGRPLTDHEVVALAARH